MQTKSVIPLSALLNTSEENSKEFPLLLKLNKKRVRSKAGTTYQIIRYDKDFLSHDLYLDLGMYRSLILNLDTKKVAAMAPPKSLQLENKAFAELEFKDIQIEEFVEGTMINMFFNTLTQEWDIATRSNIGARCSFYQDKKKTFRTMFLEAMNRLGYEFEHFDKNFGQFITLWDKFFGTYLDESNLK